MSIDVKNQAEIERKTKLAAIKNYKLSDNYTALKKEVESRKDSAKATVVTAYLSPSEDGEIFTEVKKYNHKNKFAWGCEVMSEMIELIDDSAGGTIIKEKIQDGINNSEEHIGCALVKMFPGSSMAEFRYSDVDFTDSDRLIYKAQVAADTIRLIDSLEEEFSKEAEQDVDCGVSDDEPVSEDVE